MMKDALRHFAIKLILTVISLLRLDLLFPKAAGRGVIFTLHHVRPPTNMGFNPNAGLDITPEFLETAIIEAKRAGLFPVRLEDLPRHLAGPDVSQKFVCFTLDDGNRDNVEFAAPIFRKHNVPFSIFICPGLTTRNTTMWWETIAAVLRKVSELRFDFGAGLETLRADSLAAKSKAFNRFAQYVQTGSEAEAVAAINVLALSNGVDPKAIVEADIMSEAELFALRSDPLLSFGAHSMTHRNLARLSENELAAELTDSRAVVSGIAAEPVRSFAYPYGWTTATNARVYDAARAAGIEVAVTTQPGVLKQSDLGRLTHLNRVSLNGHYQKPRYVRALISGIAFWFI